MIRLTLRLLLEHGRQSGCSQCAGTLYRLRSSVHRLITRVCTRARAHTHTHFSSCASLLVSLFLTIVSESVDIAPLGSFQSRSVNK
jgi:hypothetical protein